MPACSTGSISLSGKAWTEQRKSMPRPLAGPMAGPAAVHAAARRTEFASGPLNCGSGRPFLIVPSVVEQVTADVCGEELPLVGNWVGADGRSWNRFELPAGGV